MPKTRPTIGITTYGPEGQPPAVSLPMTYVEAVSAAGGNAILLAPNSGEPAELLELIDGLILSGGGDVGPDSYGGADHPALYNICPARDVFELELVRRTLESPTVALLGICRGMQVLNIALGGDLEAHLPDRRGEEILHRLPPRKPTSHRVEVAAGEILERIYGRLEFEVCSWHHQEVRRLGEGLRAIARAADGVVEGLVLDAHPFALGVQWHPEMQVSDDPLQRRLFEVFVDRARSGRCG